MSELDLAGRLEDLFRETGEAHHQAYIETDGADPEWPLWYAGYLQGEARPAPGGQLHQERARLPPDLGCERAAPQRPGADWARYYADFFLQRYAV